MWDGKESDSRARCSHMAHRIPECPCQLWQAITSAWWADSDAKYIIASLPTWECSTHSLAKWANARNEEVRECNEMPTKDNGENDILMAAKGFGLRSRYTS